MKKSKCFLLGIAIGSLAMSNILLADERSEIKQRIEALRVEAKELASHGKEDEASERMKMVRELSARLRMLAEPQAEGVNRAENREREEMLHQLARRVDQLRAAAAHLKEAEMPDMAHEVGRRAEEVENKLRAEKERFAIEIERREGKKVREKMPPIMAQRQGKDEAARDDQEAWGRRVKEELARHAEALGDVRAEHEKMRRELKELRALIERMKSETKGMEEPRKERGHRD